MNVPAETRRDIIEAELIENFHWLPQDIREIPYKSLQKLFIIRKYKTAAMETKAAVQKFKSEHSQTRGRGQTVRYREV